METKLCVQFCVVCRGTFDVDYPILHPKNVISPFHVKVASSHFTQPLTSLFPSLSDFCPRSRCFRSRVGGCSRPSHPISLHSSHPVGLRVAAPHGSAPLHCPLHSPAAGPSTSLHLPLPPRAPLPREAVRVKGMKTRNRDTCMHVYARKHTYTHVRISAVYKQTYFLMTEIHTSTHKECTNSDTLHLQLSES